MTTEQQTAFTNLNIPVNNKIILSIDGGGIRGILTLQLLKKLEQIAGSPCYKWCNMIAGTSTGAIISGLMMKGHSAIEIEDFYTKLVSQVFTKRNLLADRFINPPAFDKKNYRALLKSIIGDVTLKDCCENTSLDILITSKDMAAGEETFFTCFNNNGITGTYKDVLLRGAMEATMSAPTYFRPLERFIDGGTTTFNNPVGAAIIEALCYGGKGKYNANNLTVFSFGTGTTLQFVDPKSTGNPAGIDTTFWLNYVMSESSKDASDMQLDVLRCGFMSNLDFRRFQISLDETSLHLIPNKDISDVAGLKAKWLYDLSNNDLSKIDMSDVTKFPLVKRIGEAVVEHICPPSEESLPANQRSGNWFKKDLLNANGRDELVTAFGDVNAIQSNMSSANWIDSQPS